MNVATVRINGAAERWAVHGLEAIGGIRWAQIRIALLLGVAASAWSSTVYLGWLLRAAESIPLGKFLLWTVIDNEIRALCLLVAVAVADRAVDEGAPRRRAYVVAAIGGCVLGTLVSWPLSLLWHRYVAPEPMPQWMWWVHGPWAAFYEPVITTSHWLLIGGAAVFFYADRRAARRTADLLRDAELDRLRRSRTALESRLQAMQARVEPQFLLGTLRHVGRLYEREPSVASGVLDNLITYLRAAMPVMRDTSSTVGQEFDLAISYLAIVGQHRAEGIEVHSDLTDDAARLRMPPMLLLPLIDDAIVRGMDGAAPQAVTIAARVVHRRLQITIARRGAPAGAPSSADDGANSAIRERLEALYRGDAMLHIHRSGEEGLVALLDLPLEPPPPIG